ncbi:MAG TPA: penicillin-binding protein 2, partial [Acidobacteria bacterium]|nr:penicillin-binding protein 2 [Acidobacteriota bacterium]
ETPPRPGHDLTLTLDLDLQRAAARALGEDSGAVVALDPRTGAIRVFYSSPSFDPNIFVGRLSSSAWAGLRDDPEHPLQDRCIQGVYPPGSTIKPFYALAGLATGAITPSTRVYCRGFLTVFGHTFHCWRRGGHGSVDLVRSLESSCDVYYYTLGRRLGIETMASWLRKFGFGSLTGSGLPAERSGLVGTPEWSRTVRHHPWYPGTSISVAIGQGPLLVTPLQLARGYAALANGGRLVTPRFFGATSSSGIDLHLDPDQLAAVVRGLVAVVHGAQGTAHRLASLPVAGKTGTSQVARLREGVHVQDLERRLRHHALFAGWEPLDDPKLVVAVIVEHGGSGGGRAAPAAGEVFAAALAPQDAPSTLP